MNTSAIVPLIWISFWKKLKGNIIKLVCSYANSSSYTFNIQRIFIFCNTKKIILNIIYCFHIMWNFIYLKMKQSYRTYDHLYSFSTNNYCKNFSNLVLTSRQFYLNSLGFAFVAKLQNGDSSSKKQVRKKSKKLLFTKLWKRYNMFKQQIHFSSVILKLFCIFWEIVKTTFTAFSTYFYVVVHKNTLTVQNNNKGGVYFD